MLAHASEGSTRDAQAVQLAPGDENPGDDVPGLIPPLLRDDSVDLGSCDERWRSLYLGTSLLWGDSPGLYTSGVADQADAVAHQFTSSDNLSTSGARWLQVTNGDGVQKFALGKESGSNVSMLVGYDLSSQYWKAATNSSGGTTFSAAGSSPSFTFLPNSTFSAALTANGTTALNGATTFGGEATHADRIDLTGSGAAARINFTETGSVTGFNWSTSNPSASAEIQFVSSQAGTFNSQTDNALFYGYNDSGSGGRNDSGEHRFVQSTEYTYRETASDELVEVNWEYTSSDGATGYRPLEFFVQAEGTNHGSQHAAKWIFRTGPSAYTLNLHSNNRVRVGDGDAPSKMFEVAGDAAIENEMAAGTIRTGGTAGPQWNGGTTNRTNQACKAGDLYSDTDGDGFGHYFAVCGPANTWTYK
jgi:hypothetical protein